MMWAMFTNWRIPEIERKELTRLWESQLRGFSRNQVAAAIQSCLDAPKGGWPSIGLVKSLIPGYDTDDKIAAKSWERIVAAGEDDFHVVRNPGYGAYPSMVMVSAAEREVLDSVGGVARLVDALGDRIQRDMLRKQYMAALTTSEHRFEIRRVIDETNRVLAQKAIEPPKVVVPPHEPPYNFVPRCPKCNHVPSRKDATWNGSVWDCSCVECGASYKMKEGKDGCAELVDGSVESMIDS